MTEEMLPLSKQDYYDLVSFFVSSALLLSQGEQNEELYPSLRLMDGASRLTEAIISSGGFEDEEWPRAFVAVCERSLDLVMTDPEAFVEFIGEATQMLAREMMREED